MPAGSDISSSIVVSASVGIAPLILNVGTETVAANTIFGNSIISPLAGHDPLEGEEVDNQRLFLPAIVTEE